MIKMLRKRQREWYFSGSKFESNKMLAFWDSLSKAWWPNLLSRLGWFQEKWTLLSSFVLRLLLRLSSIKEVTTFIYLLIHSIPPTPTHSTTHPSMHPSVHSSMYPSTLYLIQHEFISSSIDQTLCHLWDLQQWAENIKTLSFSVYNVLRCTVVNWKYQAPNHSHAFEQNLWMCYFICPKGLCRCD